MRISFINNKLAKLVSSEKNVLRRFGPDNGRRILLRMDQIATAETLVELAKLPQTRVHELKGDRDEQISVDVKHPYRLVMVPDHKETPRKPDGGLDWARTTQVTILEIADTH